MMPRTIANVILYMNMITRRKVTLFTKNRTRIDDAGSNPEMKILSALVKDFIGPSR